MKQKIDAQLQEMVYELWQSAAFDPDSYLLLEEIAKDLSNLEQFKEKLQFKLSTIRNRNLITAEQQKVLSEKVIGFFGMSVGSHAALTWGMLSRCNNIKIIDPDTVSPSNLNRLRFGWKDVGREKVKVVEEQLRSMNPSIHVHSYNLTEGIGTSEIFDGHPALSCIVDEIDDIKEKVVLRQLAKKRKIPVISATDVGDNVFLDIERYDLDPDLELFMGRAKGIENMKLDDLTPLQRMKLIVQIVGLEQNSLSMLESLTSIGKTLPTWPQLGSTATMAGGVIATTLKKILLGENVKSGRYYISLDPILLSDFNSIESEEKRQEVISIINSRMNR
jgi:tRNA threonylcarbamoyladenosine dehydratase